MEDELDYLEKFSLCKPEDLSSDAQLPHKSQGWQYTPVIMAPSGWRQEDSWNLVANQSTWISELQIQWEAVSQKVR